MSAVAVTDLRKEFRRRDGGRLRRRAHRVAALDDVTFTIERGECVAILGQNGSGKSTLVRLLSTLLLNDGGRAWVFGHDVFAEPRAVRQLVNRVSVEASFFKRLSSAENLAYSARFYGLTGRQTRGRIPEILERVGFPAERRGEPMENLSRGMQQKVALARALLTSPVLLLLDEPTTGLDPRSKLEVQEFIRELRGARLHDSSLHARPRRGGGACGPDRHPPCRAARGARSAPGAAEAVRGGDPRGGLLHGHRQGARGRARGGGLMNGPAPALRRELVGLAGVVERNAYLVKRYMWWEVAWFVWSVANTLTIVFIAEGIEAAGGTIDVDEVTTILLIGAVIWAYLSAVFEILTETVAWERWEGTIEYTFMAPLARADAPARNGHLRGALRAPRDVAPLRPRRALLRPAAPERRFRRRARDPRRRLALVHRDRDDDRGAAPDLPGERDAARVHRPGALLVVSGVYYAADVLAGLDAGALRDLARDLRGSRGSATRCSTEPGGRRGLGDIWPLILIGAATIPLGLYVFRRGEIYAKRHGKLKRSG